VEPNETVNLTLSGVVGATLGAPNTAVLTILEDDCTIQFTSATYNIPENGGASTIVTVSRVGSTLAAATVDFSNVGTGSALVGTDYTFAAGTLSWAVGDGASKTITIPITQDTAAEGNETIDLAISNVTGVGARLGTQVTTTATIVDDDVQFVFSAATYSVSEGTPSVTITVNRVGASVGAASVAWTNPAGGSATGGGVDYTAAPATLNWLTGDVAPKTFVINITADNTVEPDETVNLALTTPTLAGGDSVDLGHAEYRGADDHQR
jgi:hypothetical protein